MADLEEKIEIVGVDRLDEGLLVYFSDDTATLFRSQYLYDNRNADSNVPILDGEQDLEGDS